MNLAKPVPALIFLPQCCVLEWLIVVGELLVGCSRQYAVLPCVSSLLVVLGEAEAAAQMVVVGAEAAAGKLEEKVKPASWPRPPCHHPPRHKQAGCELRRFPQCHVPGGGL